MSPLHYKMSSTSHFCPHKEIGQTNKWQYITSSGKICPSSTMKDKPVHSSLISSFSSTFHPYIQTDTIYDFVHLHFQILIYFHIFLLIFFFNFSQKQTHCQPCRCCLGSLKSHSHYHACNRCNRCNIRWSLITLLTLEH